MIHNQIILIKQQMVHNKFILHIRLKEAILYKVIICLLNILHKPSKTKESTCFDQVEIKPSIFINYIVVIHNIPKK